MHCEGRVDCKSECRFPPVESRCSLDESRFCEILPVYDSDRAIFRIDDYEIIYAELLEDLKRFYRQ